ncbi:protein ALP1-like [Asparagus officinalis]|uniref:protein ALP1-like n=1 Tax=Asparagus officinalis TaxID=4686 RepID=UPI00098E3ABC|nr:protein ALP1-like [Asparagus officinalis]
MATTTTTRRSSFNTGGADDDNDEEEDIQFHLQALISPPVTTAIIENGSASDPRILRDALQRPNGLKVPTNKYYLVDLGFTNSRGFLAPYRSTRYHLNLWRGNTPTNYKELFNLRHSSAPNTIERALGVLKKRWAILRTASFFDKKTQVRIINACFILHNFVRDENMEENDLLHEVDEELENTDTFDSDNEVDVDYITSARATDEWSLFKDDISLEIFNEYQARRAHAS